MHPDMIPEPQQANKPSPNRKIFIAEDYNGKRISIVLADNRALADAFWTGAEVYPHHVLEIEPDNPELLPVTWLLRKEDT